MVLVVVGTDPRVSLSRPSLPGRQHAQPTGQRGRPAGDEIILLSAQRLREYRNGMVMSLWLGSLFDEWPFQSGAEASSQSMHQAALPRYDGILLKYRYERMSVQV